MANIYLDANDTFTLPSTNTDDKIFGRAAGNETIILQGNPSGTVLDGNIEVVQVASSAANTTLQVNATTGLLELVSGSTVFATFSGGLNGPVNLQFTDGNVTLTQTGANSFSIANPTNATNNVTISSTTSQTGSAVTLGPDQSTAGPTPTTPGAFTVTTSDAAEGSTATFTVTRDGDTSAAATVDYAVSLAGGATAADHGTITAGGTVSTTGSGTLSFAAGEASKTITIPVTADIVTPEAGEGITVTLTNPTGGTTLGTAAATSTILDDPSIGTLTQNATSVTEGQTATYTLTLKAPATTDTVVSFSVAPGDASAANQGTSNTNLNDFAQGSFNPQTVTIAAGSTTATFALDTTDDSITELPENYTVSASIGGNTVGTVTTSLLDSGGAQGQTFTLTAGSDAGSAYTGTFGNDIFEAPVVQDGAGNLTDSLQNIDQLSGGVGADVLNATLNTAGTVTPSLSGIETVNVRATAAADLNLSAATGVTNVNAQNSSAVATFSSIGAAGVGVANQNQNVNINGSTATNLKLNLDTVGTAATDITVDLGSATANVATSFEITANNAHVTFAETTGSAATASATVAASGSNEITFAGADLASIATLGVTGSGSVDFSGAAMTALTTLTAGDGGVVVDATGGVLANATTGGGNDTITAVGATVANISTGAGTDSVKSVTTALGASAVVSLGAGNDTMTVEDAAFAANATLSGGADTDTLAMAKGLYATVSGYSAAQLANVTGFEVLSITDAITTGDTIDVSKISGVTSFKAAAGVTTATTAAVTNLGANSSVELAGAVANNGTLNVSTQADTASDTVSLILNKDYVDNNNTTVNNTAASHAVVAATVETLNVNSTANQTATFTPVTGYVADTVTNTLDLTGSNDLINLVVTGDQKLIVASTAAMDALTTINASANTAGVEIDASASVAASPALTITGTAAADVITGGADGDTLNLGGGNDIVDYNAGGVSTIGTGTFDTISDFLANTFGSGTGGASGDSTEAGTQADWTGDVLRFNGDNTGTGAKVDVLGNAADATTFLANNAGAASGAELVAALDSSTGNLYVDNTGDGVADYFIQLTGVTTITEAAFDVV